MAERLFPIGLAPDTNMAEQDVGRSGQLGGRGLVHDAAVLDEGDPIGHAQHGVHLLLDEQDADPAGRSAATVAEHAIDEPGMSPSLGSSISKSVGRAQSARAVASICCSPSAQGPGPLAQPLPQDGKSSSTGSRVSPRRRRTRRPMRRFSATVRSAKSRRPCGT